MIPIIFRHRMTQFTPQGILAQLGASPASGVLYFQLVGKIEAIIDSQMLITAERLNKHIKEAYRRDMSLIPEYSAYPNYMDVMSLALSHPRNIGIYKDGALTQAKFIDVDGLGDLGDLQRIQKMVYPKGGTLAGWVRLYNAWREGKSTLYEEIVDARMSIMMAEQKAPFWELIEDGNNFHNGAYPSNGPMGTLKTFVPVYHNEVKLAYFRTISLAKSLVVALPIMYDNYRVTTISHKGQMYYGSQWTSKAGREVFAITGATSIDKLGRLVGKGFILGATGSVINKWSGWVPR